MTKVSVVGAMYRGKASGTSWNPPLGRYNAIRFATALVWQPFIQIQGYQDTMVESDDFVQALQDIGLDFFTGVPDSILGGIIEELMTPPSLHPCRARR